MFAADCFCTFFYALGAVDALCRFTFSVTLSLCVVLYALRAALTQERFTAVLGRCVLPYLFNQMGHA